MSVTQDAAAQAQRDKLVALIHYCAKLEGDEVDILLEMASGMVDGKIRYGNFDVMCAKDWLKEADAEDRDWLVYRAALIIRERRRRKERAAKEG